MRKQRMYYNEKIGNEEYTGMLTTEKSVTIPGQDMTPTELITRFTSAPRPEHMYLNDINADSYTKMDKIHLERIKDNINKNHSTIKSQLKVSTNEKATNLL